MRRPGTSAVVIATLFLCLALASAAATANPPASPAATAAVVQSKPAAPDRKASLTAASLGVVINENDPLSVRIGEYYRQRRAIPAENVVRVSITASPTISRQEFAKLWKDVRGRMPGQVQALALAWSQPFRVECMSITSAFASGFDARACVDGCQPTAFSAYFDSETHTPYDDLGLRPTMLLAARSFEEARALIDRGLAADGTAPRGTAYLLDTSDTSRNTRAAWYGYARGMGGEGLNVQVLKADVLRNRQDVLFYFTGLLRVADIRSNRFLPGALADHLTSAGGVLDGTSQMTSLEWLEAGATASYGTVVEPCNYPGKFPNIPIVIRHYLDGDTAIEAYWKSVLMPSQGLFIGEPLAAPFRGPDWTGLTQAPRNARAVARQ